MNTSQQLTKQIVKSSDMRQLAQYRNQLRNDPKLAFLFVELTDRCNLRCLHCGSSCDGTRGTFLDKELLLRTLETVAEDFDPRAVMICLTGGEPLLYPDFEEVVKNIVRLGFPWGMTTNGTLIDDQVAARLRELHLGSVTISLDGLETSHNRLRQIPHSYQKTTDAIRALHRVGIPVQVTTVVHSDNFHELEAIYRSMCEMRVASWRVINIEPIGRALDNKELLLSSEQLLSLLNFIREKRFRGDTPMDVRFGCSHYLSYDLEHEVRDNYFICGSGIYVGSILCNGDIYSCLDIERRPELVQGNIRTDRFSEVWHTRFQVFRQDRTQLCSECRDCTEKEFCGADSTHTWNFERQEPDFCIRREQFYSEAVLDREKKNPVG